MAREVTTERCPACERTGTVESYGEHPVYPAPRQPPLDLRVAVLVCRECGHVQLRQVAWNRRRLQLAIKRQALSKETDPGSRERLERIEGALAELREEGHALRAERQREKAAMVAVRDLREQIEQTTIEVEQAERAYDLGRAAELHYGRLPALERTLRE